MPIQLIYKFRMSEKLKKKNQVENIWIAKFNAFCSYAITGNPGSVIVPPYGSSKIIVFVLGKNTILKFLGNTK